MELREIILRAFQISLLLTVFGYGLRAAPSDITYLFKRPTLLTKSIVSMFVLMPIAVLALVRAFRLAPALEICLVALAISPVPPALPRKLIKASGRDEYPLGLLATVSLLSIVIVPLVLTILSKYFEREIEMDLGAISKIVLVAAILPLFAGLAVRHTLPAIADRIARPVEVVGIVLLALAVVALVGGTWSTLWRLATGKTLIAIVVFTLLGLTIGHVLGGPRPQNRIVLALATASRHPGIALALATANFPDERFGGTLLLYLLVAALVSMPYIKWQQANAARAAA